MHFLYEDVCSHLEDVYSPTSAPAEEHMMMVVAEHPQTVNVAEEGDCSVCDRWQMYLFGGTSNYFYNDKTYDE